MKAHTLSPGRDWGASFEPAVDMLRAEGGDAATVRDGGSVIWKVPTQVQGRDQDTRFGSTIIMSWAEGGVQRR